MTRTDDKIIKCFHAQINSLLQGNNEFPIDPLALQYLNALNTIATANVRIQSIMRKRG